MYFRLRAADEKDMGVVTAIYKPYVDNTAVTFEYETPDMYARFRELSKQFPWIVCESVDGVIGYAYASPAFSRQGYQWDADLSVYLKEDYHGMGIAPYLYQCLEELLTLQGYYNLYAGINAFNVKSLRLHKKLGFSSIGMYPNVGYKLGAWHDVVWVCKPLREPGSTVPTPPTPFSQLPVEKISGITDKYINFE